jgi:amino acid adenylation domain-containing protein
MLRHTDGEKLRTENQASSLCLHERVAAQASRNPEATALVAGDERLTYGELWGRTRALARQLRRMGVGPEVRVSVCTGRSADLVVGLLGVLEAGGAYVPIDPAYPEERQRLLMEDSGAAVLVTQERLLERLPKPAGRTTRVICLDKVPPVDDGEEGDRSDLPLPAADNLAYLIYTSGSTGRPKGVAIQHRSAVALVDWAAETFGAERLSRVLAATSVCFDLSVFEIFVPLALGGTVYLAENALALPSLPAAGEVTLVNTVPSALAHLLRSGGLPESVRTVNLAGEALSGALVRQIYERTAVDQVWNLYGPSEDTTYSTFALIPRGATAPPPIGRPVDGTQAYVLDASGEPVPAGAEGELFLAGAGVARGYLDRPDLTAERFVPNPWGPAGDRLYRTGDLVRLRADGELDFLGRIDHQVKIRGFRIELGEVEAALERLPAVERALVLAREDAGDKRLVAYLTPKAGEAVPESRGLRDLLRRTLPEHMVPSAFVHLEAFPLTPNGKVDRGALPAPVWEGSEESYVAPRTPHEEAVAAVWSEVLGIGRIGIADNFLELGGHSLTATQVVSRLRDALGVDLPMRAVLEHPTIEALAGRIAGAAELTVPPLRQSLREEGFLPLSFAQQGLWFLAQLAPDSAAYNVPAVLRLSGRLDVGRLARAWAEISARHETLRTTFQVIDGKAAQVVSEELATLPVVDLRGLPSALKEEEATRLALEEAATPFDLARGPLMRGRLLLLNAEENALVFNLHHIVSDGWSLNVLTRELSALYGGASLTGLPVQYADFAAWQRGWLTGPVLESQLSYWKGQLADAEPLYDLPGDRPRPAAQSFRGAVHSFRLTPELSRGLEALARQQGSTLFMALLAAFETLLLRWTHREDQVVGSPVANRGRSEVEGLIGYFANVLPLRNRVEGEIGFRLLLERVRATSLAAYAHQDLPFGKLVEELAPERNLSQNPLFQIAFALQDGEDTGLLTPGLEFVREELDWRTSPFDMVLHAWDREEGIAARLVYSADLYDAATIARLAAAFERLVAGVVAAPDEPVAALPLLSAAERETLLIEWNRTATDYPRQESVPALFAAVAARVPDRIALVCGDESLTYAELDRRANRLARKLIRRGAGPDVLVALYLQRSLDLVVATLAVLKAGGAYLPLDLQYPADRVALMLEDARPAAVVTTSELAGRLPEMPENTPPLVCLDREREAIERHSAAPIDGGAGPSSLAYVMYTSGSTGRPKGVAVPHRGVVRLVRETGFADLGEDRVFLQLAPTAFDAATLEIWGPLLNGGRLIVMPAERTSLEDIGRAVRTYGVDTLWLTAGLFHLMVQENLEGLAPLRQLLAGGDVLSVAHVEKVRRELPHLRLINGYGPTEGTTFTTTFPVESMNGGPLPIGRPIANTQIYLLDARMEPVPAGVAGELWVGGDGLARGYHGRPELTAERFIPHPHATEPGERLYRTGDLARWRADGVVEFLGRTDHQVKIRGFRIELGEIEAVLAQAPGVREAVVIVRQDTPGDRRIVAYVVPEDNSLSVDELRAALQETLPEYMVPAAFVLMEALPINPNGKVDRRDLPAPEAEPVKEDFQAPRTPLEEMVAGLWSEVLGLERIGVTHDFFDLGGHSLTATQLISRLRDTLRVDLPLRALFEAPTVESLARRIAAERGAEKGFTAPPLLPAPRGNGPLPLSFAQQRLWFLAQLVPDSPVYNIPAVLHLSGPLDRAALSYALMALGERHETLRTTFQVVGTEAAQVIAATADLALPVIDLRGLPVELRDEEAAQIARAEALAPFDLTRGPLLRVRLLVLAEEEHALVLNMHHIISDGWSVDVLTAELSTLYRGATLPEMPVQYADFAVWQRGWLTGEVVDDQLAWWKEQLTDAAPLYDLPGDRPRPVAQSFRGAVHAFDLSPELSRGVKALARRQGSTLFMALLAAFQALQMRWTDREDCVIGSPVANRNHSELEGLIGFFANMLPLRSRVREGSGYRELLARVRDTALAAYAHQDLPFERLVEEVAPDRNLSHNPIFQIAFVLQDETEAPRVFAPGLGLRREELEWQTVHFDLILYVWNRPEGLAARIAYSTDLFDAATAARLAGGFEKLLAGAVAAPDEPVGALPLLSPAERETLLVDWNQTATDYPRESTVPALFAATAARVPERVALVYGEETLTYAELDRRSNQLARALSRRGVGPDVLVGLFLERSLDLLVAILGVLKAGGAYLPLDLQYPPERLAFMLEDSRPVVLLTTSGLTGRLPATGTPVVRLDTDRSWIERQSDEPFLGEAGPSNLAYVMYTSGSTGRPKGIGTPHRGVVRLVRDTGYTDLGEDRVFLMLAPVAFDASTLEIWGPLLNGGRLVIQPGDRVSMEEIGQSVRTYGVDTLWLTTGLFHLMVQEHLEVLAPLKQVMAGGDIMSVPLVERVVRELPHVTMMAAYGPTEGTTFTSTWTCGPLGGSVPIGRPIANTTMYLLDRRMEPVPVGVAGEVYVGGDGLARGYQGRPELTAERFVPHPHAACSGERLYRTGDLARWRPDGAAEFLGRTDHQVKIRGFRIELGEIEAELSQTPGVKEAAVVVRQDTGERRIVAYVAADDAALTPEELRNLLKPRLPEYMVPAAFVVMDALPINANGKVDRKALPAPPAERVGEEETYVAPRTPVEEVIAAIWCEVLRVPQVGVYDDFFLQGGHSLLATRVVSRLREAFGLEVPLRVMFEAHTVAGLAEAVEALQLEQADSDDLERLLAELDGLSEEEAEQIIG